MGAHALLIGVTSFSDPQLSGLRAPRSDVEALKAVLEDPARGGIFDEAVPSIDEDLTEIRDKLSALLDDRRPEDMVLLYYSGHGVVDRGNNLFLATGATSFKSPRARSLASSEVREMMVHSRAGKVVVVLDCCHSGVFTEGTKGTAEAVNKRTFDLGEGAEGFYVLAATSAIQYALDSQTAQQSLSHFTSWLVDGLGRGEAAPDKPVITIDDLWSYLSRRARQSGAAMTPSRYVGRNSGEIVIARNPAAQPARIPYSLLARFDSPDWKTRLDAVAQLQDVVSKQGTLRLAARKLLRDCMDSECDRDVYEAMMACLGESGHKQEPNERLPHVPVTFVHQHINRPYIPTVSKSSARVREKRVPAGRTLEGAIPNEKEATTAKPVPAARASATPATVHSPYDAKAEDVQRAQLVRAIALDWRAAWSTRTDDLVAAIKVADKARRDPTVRGTAEADAARRLAGEAGTALSAVSLSELVYAEAYGLHIHKTVHRGGVAIDMAKNAASAQYGADVTNEYAWESIGRVLESALSLARFDVGALPRGFDADMAASEIGDLNSAGPLLVIHSGDAPGQVVLIAPLRDPTPLARLGARGLALNVLAARLNSVGFLEMVATDTQYLYGWWGTKAVPTHQRPNEGVPIAAAFIGREAGAPAVVVERNGGISFFGPNVVASQLSPSRHPSRIESATVWTGADAGPQDWRVLLVGSDGYCVSVSPEGEEAEVALLDQPLFRPDSSGVAVWSGLPQVTLGLLDGFHCALVWGISMENDHGICFLDPVTLQPLRAPLIIDSTVGCIEGMALAGNRWLLATTVQSQAPNRLLIFDLSRNGAAAVQPVAAEGTWHGDLYSPIVVTESRTSFSSVQIKSDFDLEMKMTLLRYDWPERRLTPLWSGSNLRSFLVADSPPDK